MMQKAKFQQKYVKKKKEPETQQNNNAKELLPQIFSDECNIEI